MYVHCYRLDAKRKTAGKMKEGGAGKDDALPSSQLNYQQKHKEFEPF